MKNVPSLTHSLCLLHISVKEICRSTCLLWDSYTQPDPAVKISLQLLLLLFRVLDIPQGM
jgi:hypothetical protein